MKTIFSTLLLGSAFICNVCAQTFDKTINLTSDFLNSTVLVPKSPLSIRPVFIGGVDTVATFDGNDQFTGFTAAKQWHDFIGVTPDSAKPDEFWVSVNHEMIQSNPLIGDGGGMTVFKAKEDLNGNFSVIPQTVNGVTTNFFNVNFKDHVGETGMNCGGINSPTGRIWTAEEWFRTSNASIYANGAGVLDTTDWTIDTKGIQMTLNGSDANGQQIKKYENFNWMVEIDPRRAKAIRKQYNWGRMGFEGGAIAKDNQTVYFGIDLNPTILLKFVATVPGDFTQGQLYFFRESNSQGQRWVNVDNSKMEVMLNLADTAFKQGATMLNRLEWTTIDTTTGMVYMTETGRDNIGEKWADELLIGGELAQHHIARGAQADSTAYADYYGRILKFDPASETLSVHLEGGANDPTYDNQPSVAPKNYPHKHLSNPDGLTYFKIGTTPYLIVLEDLNGTSHNRVPYGINNKTCEVYLLDLTIQNPTVNDLIRITVGTLGAEVTGARPTPSGKNILLDIQHPNDNPLVNDYPFNNSLTVAISGFDGVLTAVKRPANEEASTNGFVVYPNPVSRELFLDKVSSVAIYNIDGVRVLVSRDSDVVDISGLNPGVYIIMNDQKESQKIIIE